MSSRLSPAHIAQIGEELAISWTDGAESFIRLEQLRRACPCAVCQGEADVLGHVDRPERKFTPQSFQLRRFDTVGGYALQPQWADGHGTGLFSFAYLRQLCATPFAEEDSP
ncbi:MAG: hypothetical protein RLZZ244_677 [Verrucomicrobiota bacterium]|jgi:DUF971 family protein